MSDFFSSPKVLFYLDSMAPAGGIERVVSSHLGFFSKKHDVTLLVKDKGECFYEFPERVRFVKLDIFKNLNMRFKFVRVLMVFYRLLFARFYIGKKIPVSDFYYVAHVRNLLELIFSGVSANKIIAVEHGSYLGYNIIYRFIKNIVYPKCLAVVAPTKLDYEYYKSIQCNVYYIPNPLPFESDQVSDLMNKNVLCIGRMTNDKRHELLIRVWADVIKNNNGWSLNIVGEGENKEYLERLIHNLSLEESVFLLAPRKNVLEFYLNSSIFVLTSKYEGFGMVLAEAMECGLPVLSFNVPSGPFDIINNGTDGFLIEESNISDYSSKLNYLMNNYDARLSFGSRAKLNIKKFSPSVVEDMWSNFFEDIVND